MRRANGVPTVVQPELVSHVEVAVDDVDGGPLVGNDDRFEGEFLRRRKLLAESWSFSRVVRTTVLLRVRAARRFRPSTPGRSAPPVWLPGLRGEGPAPGIAWLSWSLDRSSSLLSGRGGFRPLPALERRSSIEPVSYPQRAERGGQADSDQPRGDQPAQSLTRFEERFLGGFDRAAEPRRGLALGVTRKRKEDRSLLARR